MIPLKVITPPATEPISLVEAKLHCHGEDNEDALFTGIYIPAAREFAEFFTGRCMITQTVERVVDVFPAEGGGIELPGSPLQSITSVKYLEAVAGVETTMPSTDYVLDKDSEPGWLLPAYGTVWPDTYNTALAVRVRYVAGWANAAAVPANIKMALLLGVAEAYTNREESKAVKFNPTGAFATMLQKHRLTLGI